LSTASSAPAFFATAAIAPMSETSVSGLEGVSRNSSLVFGRSAASHARTSVGETNVVSRPKRARIPENSCTVEPNTALEHTT
jgi:hypothetical protein